MLNQPRLTFLKCPEQGLQTQQEQNVKMVEKSRPLTESPGKACLCVRAIPVTAELSAEAVLVFRKRAWSWTLRGRTGEIVHDL